MAVRSSRPSPTIDCLNIVCAQFFTKWGIVYLPRRRQWDLYTSVSQWGASVRAGSCTFSPWCSHGGWLLSKLSGAGFRPGEWPVRARKNLNFSEFETFPSFSTSCNTRNHSSEWVCHCEWHCVAAPQCHWVKFEKYVEVLKNLNESEESELSEVGKSGFWIWIPNSGTLDFKSSTQVGVLAITNLEPKNGNLFLKTL